jgi:hypothetical protein
MPVNGLEIFEIELSQNVDDVLGTTSLGLTVDNNSSPPTIEIFTLQENKGSSPIDNIFEIIPAVRDQYFPDLKVQDINWKMTNNHQRVDMSFHETDGNIIKGEFPNGIPNTESFISASDFKKALSSPEGFDEHYKAMFGGHVGDAGKSSTIVAVPIPNHPDQVQYMRYEHSDQKQLVLVDVSAFLLDWEESNNKLLSGDDYIFSSDLNTAIKHTHTEIDFGLNHTQKVGDASLTYQNSDGEVHFVNGRHRTANLATLGAPFVPLSIQTDDLEAFKAQYEYLALVL